MKTKSPRRPQNIFSFFLVMACGILALATGLYAQDDTRPSATWQVVRYDINATLPQTETDRNLTAKAKLDLKNVSPRSASTLSLRISPAAEITAVTINGTTADFTKGEEKIGSG